MDCVEVPKSMVGGGSNKLVAQTTATLIQPSELYDVRPESEPVFMAPLSVRALPGLQRPCMRQVLSGVHLKPGANEPHHTLVGELWRVAIEPATCSSPVVMDATARATAYLIYVWVRGIHTMLWRRFLVHAESTLADIILVVEAVSNRARAASTIC
jgi:hypothetical protein